MANHVRALVVTLVMVLSPSLAGAQMTGRRFPGLTIEVTEAFEREHPVRRTATGVSAEVTRRYYAPRLTADAVLRARLYGAQTFHVRSSARLSTRTTLASTSRLSFATRPGDDHTSAAWASSGLAAATTLGVAHQVSRRTSLGLSYRFDRVRYVPGAPASIAQGVGVGIWRAASRHLTWQAGYDLGWSGAISHSAVIQAQYRLPGHQGTSVTVALRPTTTAGPVQRSTIVAGLVRVDYRLDGRRRVGVGYERSVSLVELADRSVVTDVISAQAEGRTRRLTASASVHAATSRRLQAGLRLDLRLSPRASLLGEFVHAGQGGPWAFTRTTVRVGARVAVSRHPLE